MPGSVHFYQCGYQPLSQGLRSLGREGNRTAHLWIGDSQQSGLRNSVIQLQELDSRWPRPDRSRIAISSDEDRILDDWVSTDMLFVPIWCCFAFPGQFDLLSID